MQKVECIKKLCNLRRGFVYSNLSWKKYDLTKIYYKLLIKKILLWTKKWTEDPFFKKALP